MDKFRSTVNILGNSRAMDAPDTRQALARSIALLGHIGVVDEDHAAHVVETDKRRLSWLANRTADAQGTFPIFDSDIEGEIPDEIAGTLYRTAPGQKENHGTQLKSLFDGDAFVSGYTFREGKVTFRARFIDTRQRKKEIARGKMKYSESGTLRPGIWLPGLGIVDIKNQPSVNIIPWDGRLLALSEGGFPSAIDTETFAFQSRWDFRGTLKGWNMNFRAFTAHPKFDPATGQGYAFGFINVNLPPWRHPLMIYRMEKEGTLTTLYKIQTLPHYYMIHDMILTDNWMIFIIPPVRVTLGTSFWKKRTLMDNFNFTDDDPMRIMLLKKDGSSKTPIIIEQPPNMSFHNGNGYEENGQIVFDSLLYPDGRILDIIRQWYKDPLPDSSVASLNRIVIDPDKGELVSRKVVGVNHDLPRFNLKMTGKKSRYLYTVDANSTSAGDPYGAQIVKYDLEDDTTVASGIDGSAPRVYGEPVFTPRPGGREEDDGWVLALGYDGNQDKTFLEILDGQTMSFVARIWTPSHFPLGFHGNFVQS